MKSKLYELLIIFENKNTKICIQKYRNKNSVGPFTKLELSSNLDSMFEDSQKKIISYFFRFLYPLSFPFYIKNIDSITNKVLSKSGLKFYRKAKSGSIKKTISPYDKVVISNIESIDRIEFVNIYIYPEENKIKFNVLIKYINTNYFVSLNDIEKLIISNDNTLLKRNINDELNIRKLLQLDNDFNSIFFKKEYHEFYHIFEKVHNYNNIKVNFLKLENTKKNKSVSYKNKNNIKWFNLDKESLDEYLIETILNNYIKLKKFDLVNNFLSLSFENENHSTLSEKKEIVYESELFNVPKKRNEILLNSVDNKLLSLNMAFEPKSYQIDGLKWMISNYNYMSSFLLCDEMGLGKTFEILMFIFITSNLKNDKILILTPATLINNWKNEIHKFFPYNKCKVSTEINNDANITILSYETARNKINLLCDTNYLYLILDEGQKIKNIKTKLWNTINSISSIFRIIVTGTPIENGVQELISHLKFINKNKIEYITKLNKLISNEYFSKLLESEKVPLIKECFKNQILIRKKEDYLDLPKINYQIIKIDMEKELKYIYDCILNMFIKKNKFNKFKLANFLILELLLRLRQLCSNPNMISNQFINLNIPNVNKKMIKTLELLKEKSKKSKIVFFGIFIDTLDYFYDFCIKENIGCIKITGDTNNKDRIEKVNIFNNTEDYRIFFSTLSSGGTGINLTSADTVIIYDSWWNPAVEEQAVSRLHRIGQSKEINFIKIVYKDTIEEKIIELLDNKKSLFNSLYDYKLNLDDYMFLLK